MSGRQDFEPRQGVDKVQELEGRLKTLAEENRQLSSENEALKKVLSIVAAREKARTIEHVHTLKELSENHQSELDALRERHESELEKNEAAVRNRYERRIALLQAALRTARIPSAPSPRCSSALFSGTVAAGAAAIPEIHQLDKPIDTKTRSQSEPLHYDHLSSSSDSRKFSHW